MRPGKKVSDVPPALAKIAEAYGCRWAGRCVTRRRKLSDPGMLRLVRNVGAVQ